MGETATETVPVAVSGCSYVTIKKIQSELEEMTWDVVPEYQNLRPLEGLADV